MSRHPDAADATDLAPELVESGMPPLEKEL